MDMKYIKTFFSFFTSIATAILVLMAALSSEYPQGFPPEIPFQILGAAAATAFVTSIVFCTEYKSVRKYVLFSLMHYIMLCVIMVILGSSFGWTNTTPRGIISMCIYVAAVYAVVFAITCIVHKNEADKLNRALRERNSKAD